MNKTKEKVIETAIIMFNQEGTSSISTNHLAKELGISTGNLYYHFKNKEEIIRAILEKIVRMGFGMASSCFKLAANLGRPKVNHQS